MGEQAKQITSNVPFSRMVAAFHPETLDAEARTVDLSFSSETPILREIDDAEVKRVLGTDRFYEILGHGPDEIDLSRLNEAGPLLFNHKDDQQLGAVVSARVEGGKGRATVKFSRSAEGEAKMRDVEDGILKSVSVRGQVGAYRVEGEREGYPVLRAIKWTPKEVSLVTMPADLTVGVGRADTQQTTIKKEIIVEDIKKDTPPAERIDIGAETRRAVEAERKRASKVLDAIEFCTKDRGLILPETTRSEADKNGWGYDQTVSHILQNQPVTRMHTDTKVLEEMRRAEKQEFSVCRAISGAMSRQGVTGFEAEWMAEFSRQTGQRSSAEGSLLIPLSALSTRSLLAGNFGAGGATVPVDAGPMIPKLDPTPVLEKAGATFLRGLTAPTTFPRHTTAAVAHWVAEAVEGAKSTPGFDDVMLTPHGLAAYIEIGRELAKTSAIDTEAFVRNEILRRINLGIDKAGLVGSGLQGVPKGYFTLEAAATNSVTFGAAATWAKLTEFEGKIEDEDGLEGSISWITSALTKAAWKAKSKDTGSGQYLCSDANVANGYPVYTTTLLKGTTYANRVAFGNWAQVLIGMYGAIELMIDQSAALQRRGLIGITGLAHADVAIRQGKALCRSADAGNQ